MNSWPALHPVRYVPTPGGSAGARPRAGTAAADRRHQLATEPPGGARE